MNAASTAPRAIVSGSPIPSRRSGTAYSRLSTRGLIREASANSTTARVASARVLTPEPVGAAVSSSITSGPTSTPTSTNTIAGVTDVPVSRRDTPATASTVAAMIASSHFMVFPASCRGRGWISPEEDDANRAGTRPKLPRLDHALGTVRRQGRLPEVRRASAVRRAPHRDGSMPQRQPPPLLDAVDIGWNALSAAGQPCPLPRLGGSDARRP